MHATLKSAPSTTKFHHRCDSLHSWPAWTPSYDSVSALFIPTFIVCEGTPRTKVWGCQTVRGLFFFSVRMMHVEAPWMLWVWRGRGAEKQGGGFRWQVRCRFCPRADRKPRGLRVPSNVLENSLTLRSVVLHLPVVTSSACPRTETPLRKAADFFL